MTKQEWERCEQPKTMMDYLLYTSGWEANRTGNAVVPYWHDCVSERKLRLFCCGVCRLMGLQEQSRIWLVDWLADWESEDPKRIYSEEQPELVAMSWVENLNPESKKTQKIANLSQSTNSGEVRGTATTTVYSSVSKSYCFGEGMDYPSDQYRIAQDEKLLRRREKFR